MPETDTDALPTALQLAAVTLAMQHPLTRSWGQSHLKGDDERLPRLAHAHEDDLDLATNMEMATFRASYFAFPGLDAPTYLNRWQAVSADLKAQKRMR